MGCAPSLSRSLAAGSDERLCRRDAGVLSLVQEKVTSYTAKSCLRDPLLPATWQNYAVENTSQGFGFLGIEKPPERSASRMPTHLRPTPSFPPPENCVPLWSRGAGVSEVWG